MNKITTLAVSAAALAGLVLVGCGSDSDDAAASKAASTTEAKASSTVAASPTTAEFCASAKAAFGDFQPGFDAIFNDTPNPTLEEWAAFLPTPLGEFDDVIAKLSDLTPSAEVADDFQAALDAMETVSANFHASMDAAEAGDEAAFKAAEDKNQGGDTDAMGKALETVTATCGAAG